MKCPLQSKCHGSMTAKVDVAERMVVRTQDAAQEVIAKLQEQVVLQNFQIETMKAVCKTAITEKGKKQISGYIAADRPKHPCRKCESIEKRLNRSDMLMTYCHDFDHRVDGRNGTCPNHSALKGKSRVA